MGVECSHHDATTALNSVCYVWLSILTVSSVQRVTGATKSKFKIHRKLRSQANSKIFAECKTRDYLGQNIGFLSERELKYARLLVTEGDGK